MFEAYAALRSNLRHECRKHELADDEDQWIDDKINEMSTTEFMSALSAFEALRP